MFTAHCCLVPRRLLVRRGGNPFLCTQRPPQQHALRAAGLTPRPPDALSSAPPEPLRLDRTLWGGSVVCDHTWLLSSANCRRRRWPFACPRHRGTGPPPARPPCTPAAPPAACAARAMENDRQHTRLIEMGAIVRHRWVVVRCAGAHDWRWRANGHPSEAHRPRRRRAGGRARFGHPAAQTRPGRLRYGARRCEARRRQTFTACLPLLLIAAGQDGGGGGVGQARRTRPRTGRRASTSRSSSSCRPTGSRCSVPRPSCSNACKARSRAPPPVPAVCANWRTRADAVGGWFVVWTRARRRQAARTSASS